MVSKVLVALCVLVVVASALPAGGPFGGFGAWGGAINPWIPVWSPCTTIGSSCLDCNTKSVCTKIGSIQRTCSDPTLPHCNLGECSATPSAECTAAPIAVANA